jgi:hypothetical protein
VSTSLKSLIKRHKNIIVVLFSFVLIAVIALGGYAVSVIGTKKNGVKLKPGGTFDVPEHMKIFKQNNPGWAQEYLGSSDYRLGSHGCLLAVLCTAVDYYGSTMSGLGELNALFTENDVYTETGDIIWYKIRDALPQFDYSYSRIFGSRRIKKDLEQGLLPIIMVKYKGNGINHWVLVAGADGDDFLVVDPLNDEIIPLSEHGGRAYAYRVLIPQNGVMKSPDVSGCNLIDESQTDSGKTEHNGTDIQFSPSNSNSGTITISPMQKNACFSLHSLDFIDEKNGWVIEENRNLATPTFE